MQSRNFETLSVNGLKLRVVVEGQGPLVILVHGWPQCWYLWRHMIDPLVAAGYRVAAPDMRGFGGSDAPLAIADYNCFSIRNGASTSSRASTTCASSKSSRMPVTGCNWSSPRRPTIGSCNSWPASRRRAVPALG